MQEGEDISSQAQGEEVLVLSSMFTTEEFFNAAGSYTLYITPQDSTRSSSDTIPPLKICFSFPVSYPSVDIPVYTLSHEWLNEGQIQLLSKQLDKMFVPGECSNRLRENLIQFLGMKIPSSNTTKNEESGIVEEESEKSEEEESSPDVPTIYHGTPETDRKSKFQAHIAGVHSLDEVKLVMSELMKDKKIASATHNISAYRVLINGTMHDSRDDDGETGAGDILLYILDQLNCENIVVVVTRWFGGILLGPDRFKHIQNVARAIIDERYQEINMQQNEAIHPKKLRPSEDVFHRIKWDSDLDQNEFTIGYEDRIEGVMEIPFAEFEGLEIPFHRIRYYKDKHNEIIWDRRTKLDKFFT